MGLVPEGARRNLDGRGRVLANRAGIPAEALDVLFDPQTSGGLLAAVPVTAAEAALAALREAGVPAAAVGETWGTSETISVIMD